MSQYIGQIRGGRVWVDRCLMEASHKPVPQCSCVYTAYLAAVERLCPALKLCGAGVCQVGFLALLLISLVHVGSGAATQSENPRSSPFPLSLSLSPALPVCLSLSLWLVRIGTQSSSDSKTCADKEQAAGCRDQKDRKCC